jgi:multidrug transporter EmrE-like cation transporter
MIYALLSVTINAAAQIVLKKATEFNAGATIDIIKNPFLYLTGILYLTSIIFWFVALSKLSLTVAYPMQALGYVVVSIAAILIFKENMTHVNWLGIALILLGVFFTQFGKS